MPLIVRQVLVGDKTRWRELYVSYLKFYNSEPIESSIEIVWQRLTKDEPEIHGLVAELNGEVIGFTHFHYQLSTWTHTFHCYLEDLYVSEEERGKGAATALIAEVKKLAVERKCSELFWITKESNETARKLYDKVANRSDFVRYEISLED